METVPLVTPTDIAILFALTNCDFRPDEAQLQTEKIQRVVDEFTSTGGIYNPTNKTPVEELAVMAFCKLTDKPFPNKLRWDWAEFAPGILEKLETLVPTGSE